MPLIRPSLCHMSRSLRFAAMRGIATSPVRAHPSSISGMTAVCGNSSFADDSTILTGTRLMGTGATGSAMLASSPLFLTELDPKFQAAEWIFVLSGPINRFIESSLETDLGPAFLNAMVLMTLLRFGMYYGFWQPSYVYHFQERFGQTWTVGHHLNGCDLPNPLKKGK
mmetsp:Transcript_33138/g.51518  ORF Transcript_33138/g.51518 Transcript_33138/m.51518 type:complete len:168 (-) Transcript_33138:97-600(-)